jgi:hypothetical protein
MRHAAHFECGEPNFLSHGMAIENFVEALAIFNPWPRNSGCLAPGRRGQPRPELGQLAESAMHGSWLYAIPLPLSVTGNDNAFVTMFFPLSWWISNLHFAVGWMFYVGSVVVSTSLLFF